MLHPLLQLPRLSAPPNDDLLELLRNAQPLSPMQVAFDKLVLTFTALPFYPLVRF